MAVVLAGVLVVGVASLGAAGCDDDGSPTDEPATTLPAVDSVTTIPAGTPTGGSGPVEPGTNLVPTSDDVPGSSGPGALGESDTSQTIDG
jgi:hypothetical protein